MEQRVRLDVQGLEATGVRRHQMHSIVLWFLGVPILVIVILGLVKID